MAWSNLFVQLDKTRHDRSTFNCGEIEQDQFIKTKAANHMNADLSRTMVLPESKQQPNDKHLICAFYTITVSSISRQTLPKDNARKLLHYPVPVFLLAQLAVHSNYHKQGLGSITLISALKHLWRINNREIKAYAVIVDCLNNKAEQFYLKYNFQKLDTNAGRVRMFLPMNTIESLIQKQ